MESADERRGDEAVHAPPSRARRGRRFLAILVVFGGMFLLLFGGELYYRARNAKERVLGEKALAPLMAVVDEDVLWGYNAVLHGDTLFVEARGEVDGTARAPKPMERLFVIEPTTGRVTLRSGEVESVVLATKAADGAVLVEPERDSVRYTRVFAAGMQPAKQAEVRGFAGARWVAHDGALIGLLDRKLVRIDLATSAVTYARDLATPAHRLHAVGSRLLVSCERRVCVLDAADGHLVREHPERFVDLAAEADQDWYVVLSEEGTLRRHDLAGNVQWEVKGVRADTVLASSPWVVVSTRDGGARSASAFRALDGSPRGTVPLSRASNDYGHLNLGEHHLFYFHFVGGQRDQGVVERCDLRSYQCRPVHLGGFRYYMEMSGWHRWVSDMLPAGPYLLVADGEGRMLYIYRP